MIYYISEETREAQVTYVYGSAKVRVDPARVSGFRAGFRVEDLKIQVSGRAGFRRGRVEFDIRAGFRVQN